MNSSGVPSPIATPVPSKVPAVPIPPLDLQGMLGRRDHKGRLGSTGPQGPSFTTVGSITHAVLGALREASRELMEDAHSQQGSIW